MKILILDTRPVRRGAQVFGRDLQGWLVSQGHECRRLYLYSAEGAEALPLEANDGVLNGQVGAWSERVLGVNPRLTAKALCWIKDYKPDVVLLNGSSTARYGTWLRWFVPSNTRWVARIIGDVSYGLAHMGVVKAALYRTYGSCSASSLDGVVAVGQQALASFRAAYGYRGDAAVISRAVDVHHFAQLEEREAMRREFGVAPGEKVLMFLGSLSQEKRPDRFLRVFAAISERFPKTRACIIGDGPLRAVCEDLSATLGITRQTDFFGYQADVRFYLGVADALFLSSDTEGVPGAVLEAACMGVPIVATGVGDVNMCVHHGVTGFVVEQHDEQAAANAILEIFCNSDLALQMGNAGASLVRARFSMDEIGAAYQRYFQSILGGNTGGGV